MTKFETVGIQFQNDAVTRGEAIRSFQYSCRVCSERGIRIDCDKCCIANVHAITIAAIETREEMERKKADEGAEQDMCAIVHVVGCDKDA